jgi:beta-galactosidase
VAGKNGHWTEVFARVGAEIGADGLLGRKVVGKGVAVYCQVDPDRFDADRKTYFRYTRWRSTRAVAQLLANQGVSFRVDRRIFHPLDSTVLNLLGARGRADSFADQPLPQATSASRGAVQPSPRPKLEGVQLLPYYHPDYRTDFPMGDNPYRYYRW